MNRYTPLPSIRSPNAVDDSNAGKEAISKSYGDRKTQIKGEGESRKNRQCRREGEKQGGLKAKRQRVKKIGRQKSKGAEWQTHRIEETQAGRVASKPRYGKAERHICTEAGTQAHGASDNSGRRATMKQVDVKAEGQLTRLARKQEERTTESHKGRFTGRDNDSETRQQSDDDVGDDDFEEFTLPDEFTLSDVSMEDIFAELTKIIPKMAKKVTINQAFYLASVCNKYYQKKIEGDQLGRHLASLSFVELFQQHWRDNFEKVVSDTSDPSDWYKADMLLSVMWNLSDKCTPMCVRILKVNLHSDILNFLETKHLKPILMKDDKPSLIVKAFMGIMHNVVRRASGARESLRACDAVERIQPFRECSNRMVSCVSLMIQSYLVTEEENEKINSDDEVFELLVKLLNAAIKQRSYMGVMFSVIEVLEVLNNLAVNDKNKYRIVKSGVLPYYVDLMGADWTTREQAEAAHGLWILAFKCKDEINNQPGCIEALKALIESSDEKVKKEAEGALWILEEKIQHHTEAENTEGQIGTEDGHIFISYQWDSKATVFKIKDRLKAAGFRVWIDEDDMSGSVLDAMATAVEKAAVVVVCLSQKYKESTNCRTEAEYTFRLKKKILPIRVQAKYYPDGWLGIMVGSKLVLDFSDMSKVQENMKHLIRGIGDAGKGLDETDLVKSVSVPVNDALNYPSHDKSSPVKYWTKDDVSDWMMTNSIQHLTDLFSSFNGSLLLEYNAMRNEAPESFYAYLMKNNISLSDALSISLALKSL